VGEGEGEGVIVIVDRMIYPLRDPLSSISKLLIAVTYDRVGQIPFTYLGDEI